MGDTYGPDGDPTRTAGIQVQLTGAGLWVEVCHHDGAFETTFITARRLRWLVAAPHRIREEAFAVLEHHWCRED